MSNLAERLSRSEYGKELKRIKKENKDLGDYGKEKKKKDIQPFKTRRLAEKDAIKDSGRLAMSRRTFSGTKYPEGAYTSKDSKKLDAFGDPIKVKGTTTKATAPQPPMEMKDFGKDPDDKPGDMKYGGGVPGMKGGGKPRGCGIAVRGIKPTKMR